MSEDVRSEFSLFTEDLKVFHVTVRSSGTHTPYERCRHLWVCVLLQQVRDAFTSSQRPEARLIRESAKHWLLNNRTDFNLVCYHAGFNPCKVRSCVARLLSSELPREHIHKLFPGTYTNGRAPQARGPKAKTYKDLCTEK